MLHVQALLAGGMETYFPLSEHFITQADPAFCGLGSLTMILNALAIDPYVCVCVCMCVCVCIYIFTHTHPPYTHIYFISTEEGLGKVPGDGLTSRCLTAVSLWRLCECKCVCVYVF